jgi:hypothetical protein
LHFLWRPQPRILNQLTVHTHNNARRGHALATMIFLAYR